MRSIRVLTGLALVAALAAAAVPAPPAAADEGMWLFNEFPADQFRETYGYVPSPAWLAQVREAAVRFNNGGSGSFVSDEGLVLTNHHVGFDCIQKVSSAEADYVTEGFTAATRADELPCPDLELNVLESIERVTARVQGAVTDDMDAAAAGEARRAAIAAITAECKEATGLRCDVVRLYAGGEYDLYRYRRYTDVRLVWAPELQLANFGGDPDNFEYPRFNVDAAIFRVYEGGKALEPESFLPVDAGGPEEGEVSFVVGNPGSTGRLATVAQLEWMRDVLYPYYVRALAHRRDVLLAFSARGEEQARIARDQLLGVENGLKAVSGYLSGLLDEDLMVRKAAEEAELRRRVRDTPELAERLGDPWAEVEAAQELQRTFFPRFQALAELGCSDLSSVGCSGRAGRLAAIAWRLVRLADQRQLPDAERLAPYREPSLPSLYQDLYSEAPIHPELEEVELTQALSQLLYNFGPTHPLVVKVFGDASPAELAAAAVAGTKLGDVAVRRQLVEGGAEAVAASEDPLVVLVRQVEPHALKLTEVARDRVDAVEEDAGGRIAEAFFTVRGRETYPDATFTPRISFGRVLGYEQGGETVRWHTTYRGMVERAKKFGQVQPFQLPERLVENLEAVDLSTSLDFVTTHDIIGGNSGSPVIDREGNFIGIVFDGNLEMLPNRFVYSDRRSRAISVDVRAILEALTAIYPAEHVADELLAGALATRGASLEPGPGGDRGPAAVAAE